MKQSLFFPSFFLTSAIAVCISQPAWAQLPPIVEITDLRLEATEEGFTLVITTADGSPPQFFETRSGNTLVVDLLNARLRLPGGGQEFLQENPVEGIASISIKQQYRTGVFVTIVGQTEVPIAEVTTDQSGLVVRLPEIGAIARNQPPSSPPSVSETPTDTQPPTSTSPPSIPGQETPTETPTPPRQPTGEEELPEVVVTAEPDPPPPEEPDPPPPEEPRSPLAERTYTPPKTSSVSRDDSEILDTPQDIDVVPEEIIEDRADRTVGEALENISGVTSGRAPTSSSALTPIIRGFESQNILRNGLRDDTQRFFGGITTNVERIEVLKGPASILFGQGNLGGTVNLVTKVPQSEPFFSFEFRAGEYDFYRPEIDITGPLNDDGTVSYRLAASFERSNTFKDFEDIEERILIAPSVTWLISDHTKVTFEAEYVKEKTSGLAPELPA
ncbi:MAG: TonB-dependent receptor plug domain-containing protein, partial [Cyanobacteria bacterium P01_G01_bin.49]